MAKFSWKKIIIRGGKNLSFLTIGNVVVYIISFIGLFYFSNFLGEERYGDYSFLISIVAIFNLLTFTQMNKVLIRAGAKDKDLLKKYIEDTTGIKLILALVAVSLCVIFAILSPYNQTQKIYIIIYSVNIIHLSFHNYFFSVYQAIEKFQYISLLNIFNRGSYVFFAILSLYLGFGLMGLIIVSTISNFTALFINYRVTKRFIPYRFNFKPVYNDAIVKASLIFSLIFIFNYISPKVDLVMIYTFSSRGDTGVYAVAERLVEPMTVFRNLIAVSFFPIFVKIYNKNKIKFINLFKFSIITTLIFILFGVVAIIGVNILIPMFFREDYIRSLPIFSILIFFNVLNYSTIPFTNSLQATHNEKRILAYLWFPPILNIGLNLLFLHYFGLIGIAYSTLLTGLISFILIMIISWFTLRNKGKKSPKMDGV